MATKKTPNDVFALGTAWGMGTPAPTESTPATGRIVRDGRTDTESDANKKNTLSEITGDGNCDVIFKNLRALIAAVACIQSTNSGLEITKVIKTGYRTKQLVTLGFLHPIDDIDPRQRESLLPATITDFHMYLRSACPYLGTHYNLKKLFRDGATGLLLYRREAQRDENIGVLLPPAPRPYFKG